MCKKLTLFVVIFNLGSHLVTSNNDFPLNLYHNLDKNATNVVISPLSIEQSLSIMALAAHGSTATELYEILGREGDSLLHSLSLHSKSFITANRVYIASDRKLSEKFQSMIEKEIGYAVGESMDFKNSALAALKINEWVSNQTDHKINDLVDPEVITSDTRVVLVNGIYFKGVWKNKFPKENTFVGNFYVSEKETKEMEFMQLKTDLRYNQFEELGAAVVELPYENENIAMYVILPKERTGLKNLLAKFHKINFSREIDENLIEQKVDVTLPRFKTEFSVNLNGALKHMGARIVFSNAADFRHLLGTPEPIQLSDVVHKAVIEVNEEGVVGTAATEGLLISRCAPLCEFLVAEHPFLYVIYDKSTQKMLFMGEIHS